MTEYETAVKEFGYDHEPLQVRYKGYLYSTEHEQVGKSKEEYTEELDIYPVQKFRGDVAWPTADPRILEREFDDGEKVLLEFWSCRDL